MGRESSALAGDRSRHDVKEILTLLPLTVVPDVHRAFARNDLWAAFPGGSVGTPEQQLGGGVMPDGTTVVRDHLVAHVDAAIAVRLGHGASRWRELLRL